jgi:hypothetical protein
MDASPLIGPDGGRPDPDRSELVFSVRDSALHMRKPRGVSSRYVLLFTYWQLEPFVGVSAAIAHVAHRDVADEFYVEGILV